MTDQCLSKRRKAQISCVCDMNESILTGSSYLASVLFLPVKMHDSQVTTKTLPIERLGVPVSGRCVQHIRVVWRGWSVGRCEIKCEIKQMPALRLVGVCYSGIPRRSLCGPASSENILRYINRSLLMPYCILA